MIRLVAFAVRVSKGSSQTCNCQLTRRPDKDNHIVLIDPDDSHPLLADEPKSQTAEFTPAVRLDHPRLKWSVLNNLIQKASGKELKVRVTDYRCSIRITSFMWHYRETTTGRFIPFSKLEYCPKFKHCEEDSDDNRKDLEDQP